MRPAGEKRLLAEEVRLLLNLRVKLEFGLDCNLGISISLIESFSSEKMEETSEKCSTDFFLKLLLSMLSKKSLFMSPYL